MISNQIGVKVYTKINPKFIRPRDNKMVVGLALKIESEIGWKPEISLIDTIEDMIIYSEKGNSDI